MDLMFESGDGGFDEALVSTAEAVEQREGVRIKLGDAFEDLFLDMVHVGEFREGTW